METQSEVAAFFKNQTIFLTGGTGFVGKLLIEKLLRVCYHLNAIYILVRPKRDKSPEQRLEEIFDYPCFHQMKREHPDFLSKIRLVTGDCTQPNLGLAHQDQEILKKVATVVIHTAANVKFNLDLRQAGISNVGAVQDILNLAKQMEKLKAFVYVSTAYSSCPRKLTEEKFYQPRITAEMLSHLLQNFDDDFLNAITPRLLQNWPNTYTFTKCISEDLVRLASQSLPVAIVRPAIIGPTYEEPMPGWIDNFYGIVGIGVGSLMGVIKNMHVKKRVPCHLVPCDFVANLILASAWNLSTRNKPNAIYNFTGSENNIQDYESVARHNDQIKWKYPINTSFWFPFINLVESLPLYHTRVFFQHTLVAYLADLVLVCIGRKPLAVSKIRKINEQLWLTSYFATNFWKFDSSNVEKLWLGMNEVDKKLFRFNMGEDFDWHQFWSKAYKFGRIYLLKEPLEKLPKARKRIVVLALVHYLVVALFWFLLFVVGKNVIFYFIAGTK